MLDVLQGHIYVASETSAFSRYTKNFIAMEDGEIGTIRATDCDLDISRVQVCPKYAQFMPRHGIWIIATQVDVNACRATHT